MAQSPAHRFGQIIGEVLEAAVLPLLGRFAQEHGLYLDKKGDRPGRRGKKCSWRDLNGNSHDLDFVLERGGTPAEMGIPVAFIETAWRRYTKHSRNKAQEIQGAIEPLAQTYRHTGPFKGAILAGVFTDGALNQLRSLGFVVLYFPYDSVVGAFAANGIDASFDEDTPDIEFQRKVDAFDQLSGTQRQSLAKSLVSKHDRDVQSFLQALGVTVSRQVDRIVILALHGRHHETMSVADAIAFIQQYQDDGNGKPVERFEIEVRYNNGDVIRSSFKSLLNGGFWQGNCVPRRVKGGPRHEIDPEVVAETRPQPHGVQDGTRV